VTEKGESKAATSKATISDKKALQLQPEFTTARVLGLERANDSFLDLVPLEMHD
jgi:hypothetical protein